MDVAQHTVETYRHPVVSAWILAGKITQDDSMGGHWQLHEALCPKHLDLRGKRESLLCYKYIRGAWHQLFPEPAGTPVLEILWRSQMLSGLPEKKLAARSLKNYFILFSVFLTKAVSCHEFLDSDCEQSASKKEFSLMYLFGVINSRGRKPLYIWQLISAMWSWWKCCWRQAVISRLSIR